MIERIVTPDGLALAVPGIVPKLSDTPGALRLHAPALGEHTEAVLSRLPRRNEREAGDNESAKMKPT